MKRTWFNFFSTQFLGVFNDNLLKNFICFVAVLWLPTDQKENVIALASGLMVLPFILLSPLAGSFAERFRKAKIYQIAKVAEIPIVLIASVGFVVESLPLVLLAMLLMGVQSALYSPAKYGLIKEYLGSQSTGAKLGLMELLSFSAVLIGTLVAGFVADANSHRNLALVGLMMFTAALGFAQSSLLKSEVPSSLKKTTTINPVAFLRAQHKKNKAFKGVNLAIIGLGAFWFIASMIQMNLLIHCADVLNLSSSSTGVINALVAVGIGVGCFVSGRWNKKRVALGTLFFSAVGMGVLLMFLTTAASYVAFVSVLMGVSFFGGVFKIPLNAWVQDKSPQSSIGQVLAYSNMIVFLSILLSSFAFAWLSSIFTSNQIFLALGVLALIVAVICLLLQPITSLRTIVTLITKALFRIKVGGQDNVPAKGGIIACNHVSMLDALLILQFTKRNVRFVMHEAVYVNKRLNPLFKSCRMIPIASGKSKKVLSDFTERVRKEVEAGHLVCIFPEGRLNRTGQLMPFKKGIEKLAQETGASIFPMHMHNLIGTPLSFIPGRDKRYSFHPKNLRQKIYVSMGEAMSFNSSAFQVRQKVKELELVNINNSLEGKLDGKITGKHMRLTFDRESLKKLNINKPTSLIVDSKDVELKDLMGRTATYIGTKQDRNGKPIPGVHVEIRNESNELCAPLEKGMIYLKSAYHESMDWFAIGIYGFMDECGFVKYTNQ